MNATQRRARAFQMLTAERDKAVSQRDELLAALKPFAFAVKGEIQPDVTVWTVGSWHVYGRDFIAARAAIAKVEGRKRRAGLTA